jgi:hypothetical protein
MTGPVTIREPSDALLTDCLRIDHIAAGGGEGRGAELRRAAGEGRMRIAVLDGSVVRHLIAPTCRCPLVRLAACWTDVPRACCSAS